MSNTKFFPSQRVADGSGSEEEEEEPEEEVDFDSDLEMEVCQAVMAANQDKP